MEQNNGNNPHTGSSVETLDDELPSQEITQGNNSVRPRRGRPRNPETQTPNQVEAEFQRLMATMEEAPDPVSRSLEEIVEYNKKIISMVQNILLLDLKTVHPRNVARITTPNGIQKLEVGGLPDGTRHYLLKILENCFKAVSIMNDKDQEKDVSGDVSANMAKLANELYKGIPGLNKDGKKL